MTSVAEITLTNQTSFYVDNKLVNSRTDTLMQAYASGSSVCLFDYGRKSWISGHIQGIRNESGSAAGKTPRLFIVTLALSSYGECVDVFVRTVC